MRFTCLQETLQGLDIKDNFSNGLIIFFEALKMTGRLLKQPGYFFKRNSQKRRLSFPSLLFSMVVLFSIACNVYQLAPSQKRKSSFHFKILRN